MEFISALKSMVAAAGPVWAIWCWFIAVKRLRSKSKGALKFFLIGLALAVATFMVCGM